MTRADSPASSSERNRGVDPGIGLSPTGLGMNAPHQNAVCESPGQRDARPANRADHRIKSSDNADKLPLYEPQLPQPIRIGAIAITRNAECRLAAGAA